MDTEEIRNTDGSQPFVPTTDEGTESSTGAATYTPVGGACDPKSNAVQSGSTFYAESTATESVCEAGRDTNTDAGQSYPAAPRQISEDELRQIRRAYFTVRHDRVEPCGHRFDRLAEPRTNCEFCWFGFFETHAELIKTVDEAFIKQGAAFVEKLRGRKFVRFFGRFMSTKLAMQKEAEHNNETIQ